MRKMDMQVSKNDSPTKPTVSGTGVWERETENTPVYAVVSTVAEAEGSDPVELPPLYEAINPEALNNLFTSRSEPAIEQVTFQYAGYDVAVHGSGEVRIQSVPKA